MENAISTINKNVLNYKKPNILILSKYRSSLLENKILALGISMAKREEGRAIARISAADLKPIMCKSGKVNGSFYTRLKDIALEMTGRKVFIEDPERKSFACINLIGAVTYKDNILTIKFEPDMTDILLNIKSNYTTFNLPILMSFNKVYSYRLYELLRSQAYEHKNTFTIDEEYSMCYGLSELKLTIGAVDTNAESVSRALKKPNPDFDHIVNHVAKDKNFDSWSEFRRKVIDVAVEEINTKSDLEVRYNVIRENHGGKVTKIIFYFKKKENVTE
jgi:plasmid replication initiation protein